jgi:hypothetical protein
VKSDETENFNLNHIDMTKVDIFSILTESSRFAYILTKIFADMDATNTSIVDTYLKLYFIINTFRVKNLNDFDIQGSNQDAVNISLETAFAEYVNETFEKASDQSLRTKIYYLKMINFIRNQKDLETDVKKTSQCSIYDDVKQLSFKGSFEMNLNLNDLNQLITNNKTTSNFVKYLFTKANFEANKTNSTQNKKPCYSSSAAEFKTTLEGYTNFSSSIFNDSPSVNSFRQSDSKKLIEFNLREVINKMARLLI